MAICEIAPIHLSISVDDDAPSHIHAFYSMSAPDDLYTRKNVIDYFQKGAPEKPLGGLINVGYNCYMNSVIQCLLYTPGFIDFCMSLPNAIYQQNVGEPFFIDYIAHLADSMIKRKSITPTWFLADAEKLSPIFSGPIQQDAHEFLIHLLAKMKLECTPEGSSQSFISHVFSGQQTLTISCPKCKKKIAREKEFFDIQIPINTRSNFQQAVNSIINVHESSVYSECEQCHKMCGIHHKSQTTKLPFVVMVTMLRFNNSLKKIEDFYEYPEKLTLGPNRTHYQLYAMVVHQGRHINHGHYIAYVRDQNKVWYKADDVIIYPVKEEMVMKQSPYILFYKRVNV